VLSAVVLLELPVVAATLLVALIGAFAVAGTVNLMATTLSTSRRNLLMSWTLLAFCLHLGLGLGAYLTGVWRSTGPDAAIYHLHAQVYLRHWRDGSPPPAFLGDTHELAPTMLAPGKEGFAFGLAVLYRLVGPHMPAGIAANAALAACLVPILADTTRRLFGEAAAVRAPPLLFLPSLLLWSSQLLREPAILLCITLAVNAAVRTRDRNSIRAYAVIGASAAILLTLRANVAMFLLLGIMAGLVLASRTVLTAVAAVTVVSAVLFVLVFGAGVGRRGFESTRSSGNLKSLNVVQSASRQSASSARGQVDLSTYSSAIAFLPRAMPSFLLGPFPFALPQRQGFEARTGLRGFNRQLAALPDVVSWWLLLPALVRGIRWAVRRLGRTIGLLLLPAGCVGAMLSLAISDFGTIMRERTQVVIVLVPFIAVGLALGSGHGLLDPDPEPPGAQANLGPLADG